MILGDTLVFPSVGPSQGFSPDNPNQWISGGGRFIGPPTGIATGVARPMSRTEYDAMQAAQFASPGGEAWPWRSYDAYLTAWKASHPGTSQADSASTAGTANVPAASSKISPLMIAVGVGLLVLLLR